MALPDFVLVGAQKCGTTALHSYLGCHPDIFMPTWKELNFFRDDGNYGRGQLWYESFFEHARSDQVKGEASPQYAMAPSSSPVARRMQALLPEAKILYSMRDPFDRMRSAWQQAVAKGRESRPLGTALLHDSRYLDHSRYYYQLSHFLAYYPHSAFCLIDADRLRDDRAAVLRDIFEFLGVKPGSYDFRPAAPEIHRSASKRRPSAVALSIAGSAHARTVKRVTPLALKRWALRVSSRSFSERDQEVPESVSDRLRPILVEDVKALRPLMPPSFDGWGLL